LDQNGYTIVEYVWIGGTGIDIRSKGKTYKGEITDISQLDEWNYDGSSTWQAETKHSEVLIRPVALFNDPFRLAPNKICLCDTYYPDGTPTNTNFRYFAKKIFDKEAEAKEDPWFGIEQEYILMTGIGTHLQWPYKWPPGGYPRSQGLYYCSVGASNTFGRDIMDDHYKACLYAGIKAAGCNVEVLPSQLETQVGICKGIEVADHLWMSRYFLLRIGEKYGLDITFKPKPVKGDWNGSGCHTNYSTNGTRSEDGMKTIEKHMDLLSKTHTRLIAMYGENKDRLTGLHETSSVNEFSFGVGSRCSSVRIPRETSKNGKGYYEDRRPASDMDPYIVSAAIFSVTILDNFGLEELEEHVKAHLEEKKSLPLFG